MRWTRTVAACSVLGALAATAFVASCTKTSTTENAGTSGATTSTTAAMPAAEDPVAHGRRLTWAGGCNDCHTPGSMYGQPDTTRLLSGSELGWEGPWGVSFPRNLTPDSATGIGAWSEDDIVTAITQGHEPGGRPLLPPMPWPAIAAGFTSDEVHAIARYLKSIPPVSHKLPDPLPPGKPWKGPVLRMPPPPAYDAMHLAPPPGGGRPEAHVGKAGAPGPGGK